MLAGRLVDEVRLVAAAYADDRGLARLPREGLERRARRRREHLLRAREPGDADDLRAGNEQLAVPADEPPSLEGGEDPRRRALVDADLVGELRHPNAGPIGTEAAQDRQRAIDRLHGCGVCNLGAPRATLRPEVYLPRGVTEIS